MLLFVSLSDIGIAASFLGSVLVPSPLCFFLQGLVYVAKGRSIPESVPILVAGGGGSYRVGHAGHGTGHAL